MTTPMIQGSSTLTATEISALPRIETDSSPEWPATLQALRARYRESRDLFSPCEMAHLRFLRWLVQMGRLSDFPA